MNAQTVTSRTRNAASTCIGHSLIDWQAGSVLRWGDLLATGLLPKYLCNEQSREKIIVSTEYFGGRKNSSIDVVEFSFNIDLTEFPISDKNN